MIRAAEADDAPAIAALERDALGSDAWSENLVREGAAGRLPTTHYLVATDGDELTGYAATSIVDVAELQRIAVAETSRRTGVASDLLARVESEVRARQVDRLLLEVREDNHGACAFYAARGFTEIDRRPRYYADGTTAVVLLKDL
ncbi:ribosomal protein S18-alanine N-acetyltransferase [Nocardioides cynanchi]|uniref:ribosomal protein S18-alanine N-acetyltransferase n=1 Tax=Nocardioides cynanchi TaxID=2558918 RepID=UPI0012445F6E|nr:ribosomal protein S18-alanine N-acetyltransferase [Nocardioides cynanchi]